MISIIIYMYVINIHVQVHIIKKVNPRDRYYNSLSQVKI